MDSSVGNDVSDLGRQGGVQFREDRLRSGELVRNTGTMTILTTLGFTWLISSAPNKSSSICGDALLPIQIIMASPLSKNRVGYLSRMVRRLQALTEKVNPIRAHKHMAVSH